MIISFNILETTEHFAIPLDKIVSFRDKDVDDKGYRFVTTIDMVNGWSYRLFHHEEQLGSEIVNAIARGTIEGTIFEDEVPFVDFARKFQTMPED